jgi:hypothetical protein
LYVPSLVVFDHASVAQGPHADQLTEFRQRPKQTVPSDQAPRGRSSCSARQTGMSRSCHFRLPSPTISMQPLYAVQRPVRVSDQAIRIENPTWRTRCVLFTCSVSVQDTGGYERHTFTGPHHLPTRDERHSRESSNGCRCTSRCCRKTAAAAQLLDCSAFGSYSLPRLISRCMSMKVKFGRVSLLTK